MVSVDERLRFQNQECDPNIDSDDDIMPPLEPIDDFDDGMVDVNVVGMVPEFVQTSLKKSNVLQFSHKDCIFTKIGRKSYYVEFVRPRSAICAITISAASMYFKALVCRVRENGLEVKISNGERSRLFNACNVCNA